MSECHICGEGEDGNEHRSGGPEIHTQSIKILAASQTLQFTLPANTFVMIMYTLYSVST